ncbi:GDP-D-glucose phosphorylase 1 isoform X2 [Panulirus ornatus]|uniref:GDP-D-glucose phosphorylase 1 isoform X2 n=1 Tax=Panulirus ornatus TaxID=150431 RepID=UPI003A8C3146
MWHHLRKQWCYIVFLGVTDVYIMAWNEEVNTCDILFEYSHNDFVYTTSSEHGQDLMSAFDSLLLQKWEAARDAGLFNYQVNHVETKLLPGKFRIVAQMNTKRKTMRRKPEQITSVKQPFNPEKFNFTNIKKEEILAKLHYKQNCSKITDCEGMADGDKTLEGSLAINNAPICYSHSLILPFLSQCRPQVIDDEFLRVAFHTILLSQTPDFRIAYNSLGGCASVNHLHIHVYYLPYQLYIETAECQKLAGPCYTFKDYHAPGFVFQLENGDVDELIRSLVIVVKLFLEEEMAHNMYITRGTYLDSNSPDGRYSTIRVILWARKPSYGIKNVLDFAAAACELAGHVPIYSYDCWHSLSEEEIIPITRTVCEESFSAMVPKVVSLFSKYSNSTLT